MEQSLDRPGPGPDPTPVFLQSWASLDWPAPWPHTQAAIHLAECRASKAMARKVGVTDKQEKKSLALSDKHRIALGQQHLRLLAPGKT